MVREIPLTQGKVALVDDEDYVRLACHKWYAERVRDTWYARRNYRHEGRQIGIRMHREILCCAPGVQADHVNLDGLDNRRTNLRSASARQNCRNRRQRSDSALPFKGILFDARNSKHPWRAAVRGNDHKITSRSFASADEAARAYDELARAHYGEFARTNFGEPEGVSMGAS